MWKFNINKNKTMKLNRSICLAGVLLSLAIIGCSKQTTTSPTSTSSDTAPAVALESGQACLALLDGGSYSKAWEGVAATMQSTMSQTDFDKGMQSIRTPLGKMVSRDLKSQKHQTHLPGLPDGDYWVVSYNTTFENKQNVAETLVLGLGQDGSWKVAGYSLP